MNPKVKVKMSASGLTLDECITALQALKEKGVPGETLLGVPLHEQDAILKAKANEDKIGSDRNFNRTTDSAHRDKQRVDGARLTFWVEFEQ